MLVLVLGLGVTQLLSDAVDAVRRRQTSRLHWIPMTWAAIIFGWQMQFLWAAFELQTIQQSWNAGHFILLLSLALLLFVAGSLVVPSPSDEVKDGLARFRQDGRWALLVLAAFCVLGYFANVWMFEVGYLHFANLENLVLAGALVMILFAKQKRILAVGTVLFIVLWVLVILDLSPTSYPVES